MNPTTPTDEQLELIVQHLAKTHLEIERGVRDPAHLTAHMTPASELAWSRTRARGQPLPGGAVRREELGPVTLRRDNGQVLASLTTPTQPGRWGALTFVLSTENQRVTVHSAQRLYAGRDYGRTVNDHGPTLEAQLRDLTDQRALVAAAASTSHTGSSSDRPTTTATWQKLGEELDTQIASMRTELHHRQQSIGSPHR